MEKNISSKQARNGTKMNEVAGEKFIVGNEDCSAIILPAWEGLEMLSQIEADALISMQKKKTTTETYDFPASGSLLSLPIISFDEKESFLIDVNRRGMIRLKKCTYQERHSIVIILVRLDIEGRPHTNPEVYPTPNTYLAPYNGATILCPHLHLYTEGFLAKWAIPASPDEFPNTDDLHGTLEDFFRYCNVTDPPTMQRGLF